MLVPTSKSLIWFAVQSSYSIFRCPDAGNLISKHFQFQGHCDVDMPFPFTCESALYLTSVEAVVYSVAARLGALSAEN